MEQEITKTNINWYPGHMAKTKKQIIEDLKLIDIVIEVLDARIPISSRNPDINKLTESKPKLMILNKYDLANNEQSEKWIKYFERQGVKAVLVNSNTNEGIKEAIKKIEEIYAENQKKYYNKGRIGKSIRVMILGIPNVGKSSFINRIAKKTSANVGNKPGVTRQKQWIRINEKIELLDTPGVLWPKFESQQVGINLALTGTIKDDVLQIIEIGFKLLKLLIIKHRDKIIDRYKLNAKEVDSILEKDVQENEKVLEIMHYIGRKRGAIISGGNIDEEKVAKIILEDFRNGKIGKITLEEIK